MEIKDVIMIIAVLVGPIAAVQIQKFLEIKRQIKERKLLIFKALMGTRTARVSVEHVQALNLIDIEFVETKDKKVRECWKMYNDHLNSPSPELQSWVDKSNELLIELLFEMSKSLGYSFDKVDIKNGAYSPVSHGNMDEEVTKIRKGLADVFSGVSAIPIEIKNPNDQLLQ
ncbi:MAG: DUF6680 family protein [Candidatus Kapaibacterium sp.]|nr:hypothetical protein [Bacteroidota bacterium]